MPDPARADLEAPSAFFRAQASQLASTAQIGPTLDLACGRGRHAVAAAELGLDVLAVDRNREALEALQRIGQTELAPGAGTIDILCSDLEGPEPPSIDRSHFGAIIVSRYLHRPLAPWIEASLAPCGLLLYETFTKAQKTLGWGPMRDAFLLDALELRGLFPGLEIIAYDEGASHDVRSAYTARLLARRPS